MPELPIIEVLDKRYDCLTHGGMRPRGPFEVHINGFCVWSEQDTFQPADIAKDRCEDVARLLRAAYRGEVPVNKRRVWPHVERELADA